VTAAMEEMASSTETLNEMAEELQNMAARFKVDTMEIIKVNLIFRLCKPVSSLNLALFSSFLINL